MPLWHKYNQLFPKESTSYHNKPLIYQTITSSSLHQPPTSLTNLGEVTLEIKKELVDKIDHFFPSSNPNLNSDGFKLVLSPVGILVRN